MNKVSVIMSDTRSFNKTDVNSYYMWCALATSNACKHWGFDFTYYMIKSNKYPEHSCFDPNFGWDSPRHPSWGKILACYDHLSNNDIDYLIYLDTDAFLTKEESIMDIVLGNITFGNDAPLSSPCAGFFILKKSEEDLRFLETWYKTSGEEHNLKFPWEQLVLNTKIFNNKDYNFNIFVENKYQYFNPWWTLSRPSYSKSLIHLTLLKFEKNFLGIIKLIKDYFDLKELYNEFDSIKFKQLNLDKYNTMQEWHAL